MKYTIVVLALFMAHWESISGCSGSKSQVSNRGLFGKKQLLQQSTIYGKIFVLYYTIILNISCFFCN